MLCIDTCYIYIYIYIYIILKETSLMSHKLFMINYSNISIKIKNVYKL